MPWWLYDTVVFLGTNKLFFHHLEPLFIILVTAIFNPHVQCTISIKVLLSECVTMTPNKASTFYNCCSLTNFVALFPLLESISFHSCFNSR